MWLLRMVFNVLARNVDDHSKNFSFCMAPDGIWHLSPAYDLTYGVDLSAPAFSNRHILTVHGKNEDINREDLETVAINNDIHDYKSLIDMVSNAVGKFEEYAKELDIDYQLIDSIQLDFVRV
jgi:serine/threonine-protein kinase HipA